MTECITIKRTEGTFCSFKPIKQLRSGIIKESPICHPTFCKYIMLIMSKKKTPLEPSCKQMLLFFYCFYPKP